MKPPLLNLPRKIAARFIAVACLICMTGCATRHKAYEGLERSETTIATVDNTTSSNNFWSKIQINSVDDDQHLDGRPASGYSVFPGTHWYQVAVTRRSKLAMLFGRDDYYTEAYCGFKLEAVAGTKYELMDMYNDGVIPDKERKMYRATLRVEQHLANSEPALLDIPAECASLESFDFGLFNPAFTSDLKAKGGLLCREKSDCLTERANCICEAGYSYGVCKWT